MDEMRNRIVKAQAEEKGQWSYDLTDVMNPDLILEGEEILVSSEPDDDIREKKRDYFVQFLISVIRKSVDFGYAKCLEHMNY